MGTRNRERLIRIREGLEPPHAITRDMECKNCGIAVDIQTGALHVSGAGVGAWFCGSCSEVLWQAGTEEED